MRSSKKKAITAAKMSKTSARKPQVRVKKSQAVLHTRKRKQVEDDDDDSKESTTSDTEPPCKPRKKCAKRVTDGDPSVVDVDDVESQHVLDLDNLDNDDASSSDEVRARA
jgi:hypothetical protein